MTIPFRRALPLAALLVAFIVPIPTAADAIDEALKHPQRREEDFDRDARSKPKEVLGFFGVKPGMTVVDLFAGSGYYTEIISRIVGPRGKVQKLKIDEHALGECLRKLVLRLEFPRAARSAQHNFVFHRPDADG